SIDAADTSAVDASNANAETGIIRMHASFIFASPMIDRSIAGLFPAPRCLRRVRRVIRGAVPQAAAGGVIPSGRCLSDDSFVNLPAGRGSACPVGRVKTIPMLDL